jgi:competence protein ComEC
LIPGDSTAPQEKIWSYHGNMQKTGFLLLGHHGSRTSTSEELLSQLPHLKVAIASARFARYGHPHLEVVRRLKKYHVALLKTEDWGNLWFEIPL